MSNSEEQPISMYEVLDAVEAAIKAAPKAERNTLAAALAGYADDFPDEFFWAVGAQSPVLLHHLLNAIDYAASSSDEPKRGRLIHLVKRKPEGNA